MNRLHVNHKNINQPMSVIAGDANATYKDFFIFVLIQRNLELIQTYKDLADSMKDEELKSFFLTMARLKHEDMKIFQQAYTHDGNKKNENDKRKRLSSIIKGELKRPEINSIKEAQRYAHTIESKNHHLLLQLLQLETDPSIKKLFLDALQMHKSNLNHLVERMMPFSKQGELQ